MSLSKQCLLFDSPLCDCFDIDFIEHLNQSCISCSYNTNVFSHNLQTSHSSAPALHHSTTPPLHHSTTPPHLQVLIFQKDIKSYKILNHLFSSFYLQISMIEIENILIIFVLLKVTVEPVSAIL